MAASDAAQGVTCSQIDRLVRRCTSIQDTYSLGAMAEIEALTRVASLIGPEEFARLRYSIRESCEKGRLRHWQEKLLSSVADELGIRIDTPNQLREFFEDASEVSVPITREQFLARPFELFSNEHVAMNDDWILDAWGVGSFRDGVSYDLARSVSKTGGFELASYTLARLASVLDESSAIDLYTYIRDESNRLENEWRDEFLDAFPNVVHRLPPRMS